MTCEKLVEGCGHCEAEGRYQVSIGHRCGSKSEHWHTLCEVVGEMRRADPSFHARTHEPVRCSKCKTVLEDHLGLDRLRERPCRAGYCRILYCPDCGAEFASDGPIGCPACSPLSKDPKLVRIRQSYRHKRRHW